MASVQNCLACFAGNITAVMIMSPAMCVTELKHTSEIVGTMFFVVGLGTLLQCTLGVRSVLGLFYIIQYFIV